MAANAEIDGTTLPAEIAPNENGGDGEGVVHLSGLALTVMSVLLLAAFAYVGFLAYDQHRLNLQQDSDSPAVVIASADPPTAPVTQSVLPPADDEQAETPQPSGEVAIDSSRDDERALLTDREAQSEPIDVEAVAAAVEEPDDESRPGAIAPDARAIDHADVSTETPSVAPANLSPPIAAVAVDPRAGSHVVQIGAFDSDAIARAQLSKFETSLGAMLSEKALDIERADLGAIGIFYRLRIGPFESADDARDYCNRLAESGQDCLAMRL